MNQDTSSFRPTFPPMLPHSTGVPAAGSGDLGPKGTLRGRVSPGRGSGGNAARRYGDVITSYSIHYTKLYEVRQVAEPAARMAELDRMILSTVRTRRLEGADTGLV